jgi:hypothetical protein
MNVLDDVGHLVMEKRFSAAQDDTSEHVFPFP